jgi:hypothetical protein
VTTTPATRLLASTKTVELDGDWTRTEIADVLKRLAFDPGARSRRVVTIDRDVRDLLVDALDR